MNELYAQACNGNREARNALLIKLSDVVERNAKKFARTNHWLADDARGACYTALVETLDKWIATKKDIPDVERYAAKTCKWALAGLRECEQRIVVPRKKRKDIKFNFEPIVTDDEASNEPAVVDDNTAELLDLILASCVSPAERRIVELRAADRTDAQIAIQLNTSANTVSRRRRAVEARFEQKVRSL